MILSFFESLLAAEEEAQDLCVDCDQPREKAMIPRKDSRCWHCGWSWDRKMKELGSGRRH